MWTSNYIQFRTANSVISWTPMRTCCCVMAATADFTCSVWPPHWRWSQKVTGFAQSVSPSQRNSVLRKGNFTPCQASSRRQTLSKGNILLRYFTYFEKEKKATILNSKTNDDDRGHPIRGGTKSQQRVMLRGNSGDWLSHPMKQWRLNMEQISTQATTEGIIFDHDPHFFGRGSNDVTQNIVDSPLLRDSLLTRTQLAHGIWRISRCCQTLCFATFTAISPGWWSLGFMWGCVFPPSAGTTRTTTRIPSTTCIGVTPRLGTESQVPMLKVCVSSWLRGIVRCQDLNHWSPPKKNKNHVAFEATMKESAPELFETQPDLLFHLVTTLSPKRYRSLPFTY